MASSSLHPNECQLSKEYAMVRFQCWDDWQEFDLLNRVEALMERQTIDSVEKYNILVEDIAQSYRDVNPSNKCKMGLPRDPYITAACIKKRLDKISYDYLYFRLFIFCTKGVSYNFCTHKTRIDPTVYWENGQESEHFAWFRLNGFPLYHLCPSILGSGSIRSFRC